MIKGYANDSSFWVSISLSDTPAHTVSNVTGKKCGSGQAATHNSTAADDADYVEEEEEEKIRNVNVNMHIQYSTMNIMKMQS